MSVTYTNRKNVTYYLGQTVTKTGKPRYTFSVNPPSNRSSRCPKDGRSARASTASSPWPKQSQS
jgi:hypothetical protein